MIILKNLVKSQLICIFALFSDQRRSPKVEAAGLKPIYRKGVT